MNISIHNPLHNPLAHQPEIGCACANVMKPISTIMIAAIRELPIR